MKRETPNTSAAFDALAERLRQDAEALRRPLPPSLTSRVLSTLDRQPARPPQRWRLSPPWGAALAAAAVALAATATWILLPQQPDPPPLIAGGVEPPVMLPDSLVTWPDAALIEQPLHEEAQYLLDDARDVGRFLLTRANIPNGF